MGYIKQIFIIFLVLNLLYGVSLADTGTFSAYAGMSETYTANNEAFFTALHIHGIYFDEIEYYQDLQSIRVGLVPSARVNNNNSINSASVPCIISNNTDNSTIGEGNIGWGIVGSDYYLYLYITDWNITGEIGSKQYRIWYNITDYGLTIEHWASLGDIDQPNEIGLTYDAAGGRIVAANSGNDEEYLVQHAFIFEHIWTTAIFSDPFYWVNLTKNIDGYAYNSSVNLTSPLTTYASDAISSTNESWLINSDEPPIHLHVEDSNSNEYDAYFFGGANTTLNGKVIDRSNNHIINNVSITSYIDGSFYDINTYDSPFEIIYPSYVDQLLFIKSGYTQENYTIDLSIQTDYVFQLTQIGVYANNTSTIYGNIFNYANNQTISNAHVTLSNASYTNNTYSNNYGYYEFANLSIDEYNISTYAFGYHPDDREFNITTNNTAYLLDIYLSKPSALETPTPKPTSRIGLPIYSDDDVVEWILNYWFYIFIFILILFLYVAYKEAKRRVRR